jgi:signal transduction histidine kinase
MRTDGPSPIGSPRRAAPGPWTPAFLAGRGPLGWIAANVAVAALYFALGLVVDTFFAAYGLSPAPIWLPASIATLAAMAGELRLLPGIFIGSMLDNWVLFGSSLPTAALISATNALGPFAGAAMLRHLRPQRGLFTALAGVIAFLVCTTFVSPGISAAGGAVALSLGAPLDPAKLWSIWVSWWLSDSGGTLYLAPALVLWLGLEDAGAAPPRATPRHDLAAWTAIAAASAALFLSPPFLPPTIALAFPFMLVVPLSWIALRISLRSAYAMVTLVSVVATAGTVAGFGPFNQGFINPLLLVGTLVVLLAMNVLTIVALVSERHEAESASAVKSMFLANASHELRTPLNAIIGFSSLLESEAAFVEAKRGEYAHLIRASGEHLLAVINDLLDVVKIEASRFDLQETELALVGAIDEAAGLVAVQARAKAIALDARAAALTIRADAKALRQILLNLLSNAVKFTPEGGTVAIAAARGPSGEIVIRISDSGIGIPADALRRLFAPFERAHRHTKHAIEGTGLGLSITRGLVMLHGGTIVLESEPGQGTVATIVLPASRIVAAPPERAMPAALAS